MVDLCNRFSGPILFLFVAMAVAPEPVAAQHRLSAEKGQQITVDTGWNKVISLSNLSPDDGCVLGKPMLGTVIYVRLAENQIMPIGATFEADGGEDVKVYVNLPPVDDVFPMLARSWMQDGLRMFFRTGQRLNITLKYCGAAGRVVVLDSVNAATKN